MPCSLTFAELVDQLDRELADAAAHQDRAPTAVDTSRPGDRRQAELRRDQQRRSLLVDQARRPDDRAVDARVRALAASGSRCSSTARRSRPSTPSCSPRSSSACCRAPSPIRARPSASSSCSATTDLQLLLAAVNETRPRRPASRVHELFERRAAETPDAIAVTDGTDSITYGELDARANQVAHWLRQAGVGAGDVVALCTDRSVDMVVGVLGILKAGGAYLPLNYEHPPRGSRTSCRSRARARSSTQAALPRPPARVRRRRSSASTATAAALDALEPATPPEPSAALDDLVYVIYTSGLDRHAEGRRGHAPQPRQLRRRHRPTARRRRPRRCAFGAGHGDLDRPRQHRALPGALLGRDAGRSISPRSPSIRRAFAARVDGTPLDVLKITPSHLNALLAASDARRAAAALARRSAARRSAGISSTRVRELAGCRILNHYGPTETTVGSCTMPSATGRGPYAPGDGADRPADREHALLRPRRRSSQPVPLGVPGRALHRRRRRRARLRRPAAS